MTMQEEHKLVEENINLVYHVLHKYFPTYVNDEDVTSTGFLGLVKASKGFDPDKGFAFSTFAVWCIKNEILKYFRKENKCIHTISLYEPIHYNNDNDTTIMELFIVNDNNYISIEINDIIYNIYRNLNDKQRQVFKLYINGNLTQSDIAKRTGVSQTHVSRIINKIRKLIKDEYFV